MPQFRQYPQATTTVSTDAFLIDRIGTGTMYVEAADTGQGSGYIVPDVDPSGATDSTSAILAAIATAAASSVPATILLPPGLITFSDTLAFNYDSCAMAGAGIGQTILQYIGSDTAIDLISVGDGVTQVSNISFPGFTLRSTTEMTAGTAFHPYKVAHGEVGIDIQGQTGYETIGNTLWNGAWFQEIDDIRFAFKGIFARNEGIMVNGGLGASGLKAGLWLLDGGKIGRCAVAVHCGGAFGGLDLGVLDLGVNGQSLVIDRALAAETNREIFLNGTWCDLTTNGANITIDDPGGVLLQTNGSTWIASAATHGVWVKQCGGRVLLNGRIFNNGLVSTGDGVRVDDALAQVQVNGQVHNNSGWGVNANVANNNVLVSPSLIRDNTLGSINPANPSTIPLISQWESVSYLNATVQATFGDQSFYAQIQASNPVINFDANDYYTYDRASNSHEWFVGGNIAQLLVSTGAVLYAGGSAAATFTAGQTIISGTFKGLTTTVGGLPAAGSVGDGARAFVTDASTAYASASLGSAAVGGGANHRPVIVIASAWVYSG